MREVRSGLPAASRALSRQCIV